jgi:murein DD-endopeptidase MepM/ murein hydrolase activator NlpD
VRSRQRRGLLRAQTFDRRPSRSRRPRPYTQAFVALLVVGVAAFLGATSVTGLVSARTPELRLAASSYPGLAANAQWVDERPTATPQALARAMAEEPSAPITEATATATRDEGGPALAAAAVGSGNPPATKTTATSEEAPTEGTASDSSSPGSTPTPTATEESASSQRSSALDDSSKSSKPQPLYQTYVVQAGDTVSGIAARFGVGSGDIVANNMGIISDQSMLVVGASLQIPAVPGVLHNISVGETLTDIAASYGATLDDILNFAGNQISDPSNVPVGTQILVVNGHLMAPPPAAASAKEEATPEATPVATEVPTPVPTPAPPPPPTFIWPVVGNITSYFGPSHPLGIDISIAYAPVAASAAGKVVFVGGDPCCSYGYYIDIQHADGYLTRYGHLSKFLVTLGQQVAQGDTIAISGNTGYSTGAHVHFEIRRYGVVQNPLSLLP